MRAGSETFKRLPHMRLIHQNFPLRELPFHTHREPQIFIPLQGSIEITLEKASSLDLGVGSMVYIPGFHAHGFKCHSGHSGEQLVAMFDPEFLQDTALSNVREPRLISASQLINELLCFLLLPSDIQQVEVVEKT